MNKKYESVGSFTTRWVLLLMVLAFSVIPIVILILSSFKQPKDIFAFPPKFFGFRPTLNNYSSLLKNWPNYPKGVLNSLIIAFASSMLATILSFFSGYSISRFGKHKFVKFSELFLISIRMYPPVVLTVPLFPMFVRLGIADSKISLIILYATFYLSINSLIMKSFIDSIPKEIESAAEIDGAGRGYILFKMILPLSVQGLVSCIVFVVIFSWKEYMFAYVFASAKNMPAPIILDQMLDSVLGAEWGSLFAAATLQLIPILLFVLIMQIYLIKGLTAGSVKG